MLMWRVAVSGLVLLALAGCKVRIEVPEGGEVVSASGEYFCGEGDTCVLDVRDTDFDQRFVAVADDSHVFRGWRRGDGYFCGGKSGDCVLATTGFPGNDDLMQVLKSDRVFHLVPVFEPAESYAVSGTVAIAGQSRADSDVNDINAPYTFNDLPAEAQPVSNPATIGGYANVAGAGAPGPSTEIGDPDDYYAVDLLEGQAIALTVADPEGGDLDLYLLDSSDRIVDYSLNTGYHESLTVAESGRYTVNVYAYSGASNYTLSIGQSSSASGAAGGLTASADFDPDAVVVQYRPGAAQVRAAGAGDPRPRLESLAMLASATATAPGQAAAAGTKRAATARDRSGQFTSAALEEKWRALSAVKALNRRADVAYAELNYRYRTSAVNPDDAYYPLQWHYRQINLPDAWDITRGSSDVIVAVLDTGILSRHPDLRGKLVAGYDFISDPYSSGDGDGIDPDAEDPGDGGLLGQSSYHGTHVSGTVAAATGNGRGVAGVGWRTRVMPVRVLGENGGTLYDLVQGVRYAAGLSNDAGARPAKRADVINLSLGSASRARSLEEAIAAARARGVVVVAAAGNENSDRPGYPAAYPGVLSVGAVGPAGVRAGYSNYGATLDLVAPGGDLTVDLDGDGNTDGVVSTVGSETSGELRYDIGLSQGTSMASPHVAGVVALMKAVRPALTPDEVDSWLQQGRLTRDLGVAGWDGQYGHGLLDAAMAVRTALSPGTPPDGIAPALRLYPRELALGSGAQLVTISNGGGGTLRIREVSSSAGWLLVEPAGVDDNGLGQYRLRVRSAALSPGVYRAEVQVRSSVGPDRVQVIATVEASGSTASAGTLYALLIDTAGGTVAQRILQPQEGAYRFHFGQVKEGRYELFVGSDMNNDLFICDAGEACGGYRTLFDPDQIELDRPRRGLQVNVSFSPSINSNAAAQAGEAKRPAAIPRLGDGDRSRRDGGAADSVPRRGVWQGRVED